MQSLRVLLVDDSPEFLDSAERFLKMRQELQIVGLATSGQEALEQIATLEPDLVLMDLAMPGMNGLQATQAIKARPAAPRVVIMTMYDLVEYRDAARGVAADGFITKSAIRAELFAMIANLFATSVI